MKNWKYILLSVILLPLAGAVSSCSETDDEDTGEFSNWQERNDAVTLQWSTGNYRAIKSYAKDAASAGQSADYIYVQTLASGTGTVSPFFTDTVRVAYRGRLIPSKSYAEGYVFDQTYLTDDYDEATAGTANFVASGVVDGFSTALQNMHVGDHWRVHIPYALGYGSSSSSSSSVPAYSNLIFDIVLVDFWHPGETRPSFKARQR